MMCSKSLSHWHIESTKNYNHFSNSYPNDDSGMGICSRCSQGRKKRDHGASGTSRDKRGYLAHQTTEHSLVAQQAQKDEAVSTRGHGTVASVHSPTQGQHTS